MTSKMELYSFITDDGDFSIEFISDYHRMGIVFDKNENPKNDSWYYVNREDNMGCGNLPEGFVEKLRFHLLNRTKVHDIDEYYKDDEV